MFGITLSRPVVFRKHGISHAIGHSNNDDEKKKDYNADSYLLFKAKFYPADKDPVISIYDVRDAYENCSVIINERMKCDCYLQFGIDGEMAEKYYKHVERMERQYEMPDDPIPTRNINLKNNKKWFPFDKNEE